MIKLSNIVNNVIKIPPCILGAFFSISRISNDNKYFYTSATYKKSKFDKLDEYPESQLPFLEKLNSISKPFKWARRQNAKIFKIYCYIENDLNQTLDEFFNYIIDISLNNDFTKEKNINSEKKDFIRSFFELRGSIDTTTKHISTDLFNDFIQESELKIYLNDYYNIPAEYINFNNRKTQPDYSSGKNKRNPQIRIRLDWYAQNIGFLNKYKANISRVAYKEFGEYVEKDNSYLFLNTIDPKKANLINDKKNANNFYNEIDKHFLVNNKLIGENKKENILTHFMDQKFTYDSLVLVCNMVKLLSRNKNSISNKEILDFFNLFLKYGYQKDIFYKENISKDNMKKSMEDSKALLKQGLKILISSKLIEKVENQYDIINFSLINNIAISDMHFSIYFMKSYFKILLTELGVYKNFYESICKCISNNIGKWKFENASDLGDIKSKKQLHVLFTESLAEKFDNKINSIINITRILNKPIQYITFFIQEYYNILEPNIWYSIDDLSYIDNFSKRANEFISILENIYIRNLN